MYPHNTHMNGQDLAKDEEVQLSLEQVRLDLYSDRTQQAQTPDPRLTLLHTNHTASTQAFYLVEELKRLQVSLPTPRPATSTAAATATAAAAEGEREQEEEEEGESEPLDVLGCWRA